MARPSKEKMMAAIKEHPGFESIHTEDDGCFQDSNGNDVEAYWLYMLPGWYFPSTDCGSAHEPTLSAIYKELQQVEYDNQRWYAENVRFISDGGDGPGWPL